jgi:hypothetical protein
MHCFSLLCVVFPYAPRLTCELLCLSLWTKLIGGDLNEHDSIFTTKGLLDPITLACLFAVNYFFQTGSFNCRRSPRWVIKIDRGELQHSHEVANIGLRIPFLIRSTEERRKQ